MSRDCRASGFSLTELLVVTLLVGVVMAGLTSLIVINFSQGERLTNKVDGLDAARLTLERIGVAFRMARSVGDVYGLYPPPSQNLFAYEGQSGPTTHTTAVNAAAVNTAALQNGSATLCSASFPSLGDPNWGTATPAGGWPWQGQPYTLSPTTLILQLPVFNQYGYPQLWPGQSIVNIENVNTYVYQVVADPVHPATQTTPQQYLLQIAGFPGQGVYNFSTPSTPTTILSGIVGPLDGTGNISVFHYLSRASRSAVIDNPQNTDAINITGLIVNLEILNNSANSMQSSTIALKNEFFMRNNILATVIGE